MKLSIQLHLARLSLSNTVSALEIFGIERARSTVHNWVHKAEFLIDGTPILNDACSRQGLTYRVERHGDRNSVERHGDRNSVERVLRKVNEEEYKRQLPDLYEKKGLPERPVWFPARGKMTGTSGRFLDRDDST